MNHQIIMDFHVVSGSGEYALVRKELDTGIIPMPGMYVEDVGKPQKPTEITCNFEHGYYHLQFQAVELGNAEDCERQCEQYKLQGWQVLR